MVAAAFVFGGSIWTGTQSYRDVERLAEVASATTEKKKTTMIMVVGAAVATESAFHIHSLENDVSVSATPKFVGGTSFYGRYSSTDSSASATTCSVIAAVVLLINQNA